MFDSYLRYTPLMWIFGVLLPIGGVMLLRLFLRGKRGLRMSLTAWFWCAAGLIQAISVVVNGISKDLSAGSLVYRLVSSPVTGWILLGLAIEVGRRQRLNSARMVRAVCVLGGYILALGFGTLLFALVTHADSLSLRSPLAMLLPASLPSVKDEFTLRFFIQGHLMGHDVPRLILFYPWSVCLGFAGIAIFFIALQERSFLARQLGVWGGLVAVVGSMSRAAAVALLISWIVYRFRRLGSGYQLAGATLIIAIFGGAVLMNYHPVTLLSDANHSIAEMREGSTNARQMGYQMSWAGFVDSPIIGNGWPGSMISEDIPMPVGTHSTLYGVLYTGGVLTFSAVSLAMLWTLIALFRQSGFRTGEHRSALGIALALAILSYGEGIYSFALPTLFAFCWMGAALSPQSRTICPEERPLECSQV